ncbi:MAG TPA: hypothetical protein ENJ18_01350, partial [Nannocystis exedens]|nr:hypothetical protein [Nannocystis exedens]
MSKEIQLSPKGPTDWSEIAVDLRDLVGDRRGAFVIEARAVKAVKDASEYSLPVPVRSLIRVTNLGVTVLASQPQTLVRVVDLESGMPVVGARARYFQINGEPAIELGKTDVNGLIKVLPETICPEERPQAKTKEKEKEKEKEKKKKNSRGLRLRCDAAPAGRGALVIDTVGGDRAYLDLAGSAPPEGSEGLRPGERLIGQVITERGAYRPGDEVQIVGWSAVDTPFTRSNLRRPRRTPVTLELQNPRGDVVAEAKLRTSSEGKFTGSLRLPEGAALGGYRVRASLLGASIERGLKVEDFRTPEFEVSVRSLKPDVIADGGQTVRVTANYYFGGPVGLDHVSYTDECDVFRYRPPGLDPRWRIGSNRRVYMGRSYGPRITAAPPTSPTRGGREIDLKTQVRSESLAERCRVSVEVRDASFQGVGAEDSYTVHPASFYLAIETPARSLYTGDSYAVPLRAVHIDGHRVAAERVEVEITRTYQKPRYRDEEGHRVLYGVEDKSVVVRRCTMNLQAQGADATCGLSALKKGRYSIVARAVEATHRLRSEATIWVHERSAGGGRWSWPASSKLEIHASADRVQPGDKVAVDVDSPWQIGAGLLAVERAGIREYHAIQFEDKRARFDLVADDTWTPLVRLRAVAVRPPKSKNSLPRLVSARATIHQGYEHRRLAVSVEAPASAEPSETIPVTVKVRDAEGQPSAGRLALWVVDEAVLSLTNYEVPDLLAAFVPTEHGRGTRLYEDFSSLVLPFVGSDWDPWLTGMGFGMAGSIGQGAGGGSGAAFGGRGGRAHVSARSRFETTPVFLGDLALGASGVRTVKVQLPDNLSTFRVLAVASARLVDGESPGRFGVGDARLRVTQSLVLRPALPRMMRPGDRAEVAAILQNRSERPGTIDVRASFAGGKSGSAAPLALVSAKSIRVKVGAGGQVRVPFTIQANRPGRPEIELEATFTDDRGGRSRDAVKLPLEVAPERTLVERVATYGTVDDAQAIAVPIRLPKDVSPDVGGIQVSMTSTLLGGVEDAVHGLIHYPYGCVEQTASRLLPLVAIADLGALIPLDVDVDSMVDAGVERLLSMQLPGGGFAYWPGGTEAAPYSSAYATWVLLRAEKAGFKVPRGKLNQALDYLEKIVNSHVISTSPKYGQLSEVRRAIAVHTLSAAGRPARAAIEDLYTRRSELPVFARAFVLMAMEEQKSDDPRVRSLSAELLGNLEETPASAHTMESVRVDLPGVFHSDGRSDAIVLSALLQTEPEHALVPKLARGLLERRVGGAWRNTQENAYALLALGEYVKIYEKEEPDFVARAWVGQVQILNALFRGRKSTEAPTAEFRMAPLLARLGGASA